VRYCRGLERVTIPNRPPSPADHLKTYAAPCKGIHHDLLARTPPARRHRRRRPLGLFAADALIKQTEIPVAVDLFDRLPTPFGLVRYGVAPDHQKIKSVTRLYQKTLDDPRVRFFGHVAYGKDLNLDELRRFYDAILYTVGAPRTGPLGIPGERLPGSMSATEFVAWYNGHPDYADSRPDLSVESVAVIGMGNVAVDVTRILAKTADELLETDMADYAVEALRRSRVRDIYMLGRRGPAQGKFSTKELRELGELANADVVVDPEDMELDPLSEASLAEDPVVAKNVEVLREFSGRTPVGKPRRVHIKFLSAPVEVLGEERVEGCASRKTSFREQDGVGWRRSGTARPRCCRSGWCCVRSATAAWRCPRCPFDEKRAVIPNVQGRVTQAAPGRGGRG
jgi:ferredoxin--NADP+ reductase